ncbi:transposase family protein [Streptomyces sp. NPDC057428]|uniref:transposase family protein n=1 Tax=Streptomyces sp. NPDC057428 TaxID=3346129 RepID=UPI003678C561
MPRLGRDGPAGKRAATAPGDHGVSSSLITTTEDRAVPAASLPIPAGLSQLAGSGPARSDELPDPLRRLPDPRHPRPPRRRRHSLPYVLALAACSVPAGAKSLTAIVEWGADAPIADNLRTHFINVVHSARPPDMSRVRL